MCVCQVGAACGVRVARASGDVLVNVGQRGGPHEEVLQALREAAPLLREAADLEFQVHHALLARRGVHLSNVRKDIHLSKCVAENPRERCLYVKLD